MAIRQALPLCLLLAFSITVPLFAQEPTPTAAFNTQTNPSDSVKWAYKFTHTNQSTTGVDWPAANTTQDDSFTIYSNIGVTGQSTPYATGNHIAFQDWMKIFAADANNEMDSSN